MTWRELVERMAPVPAPTPQIVRDGDYTIAVGTRQEGSVAVALVTVAGRGRRIGIMSMGTGPEVLQELSAFNQSLALTPAAYQSPPDATAASFVGRWWKDSGTNANGQTIYYWYEFAENGSYTHETPVRGPQHGTFRLQGNDITLTDVAGNSARRTFRLECVGGTLYLELSGEDGGYWSVDRTC